MRLASYNVENLFDRAAAMNQETWSDGKVVLDRFAKLNALLGEVTYTAPRKAKIAQLLTDLGLDKKDETPFVILRHNRGKLIKRGNAGLQVVASGRADWAGSLELVEEPVDEEAMRNTARVINEVNADVLGVVEAESRPVLSQFNEKLLTSLGGEYYRHVMLIDGNDDRGIDVGLLSRDGYPIRNMRSHVDDCDATGKEIFSRDCPEFEVVLPSGQALWVLVNHFKSKGYGSQQANDKRRKAQAERVAQIYADLRAGGNNLVAVVGDLNDIPASDPIQPLRNTDLRDISEHPSFDDGGFPGTYGASSAGNKIDYIFLSPALFTAVQAAGVFRRGMWPGVHPKWPAFDELTSPEQAASDHAALWVDLAV